MTTGRLPRVRGELREWREVHLRECSYFAGQLYGDRLKLKRDGRNHVTGFVLTRIDRGQYLLVKTVGNSSYVLWKDREYKS